MVYTEIKVMKFFISEQYQPACHKCFNIYQSKIKQLLPNARVEHIGASCIPQAISKGDLDIFVGVEPRDLEDAVKVLKSLGFAEKFETLRTPYLCMLESISDEDVALQVVANGTEFECFLTFRDQLRANPDLVHQYNDLKLSCVGLEPDDYRIRKSLFIEQILARL